MKAKTLILSLFLTMAVFGLKAQDDGLLTITVYETALKGWSKIIVVENGNKVEEIELSIFSNQVMVEHQVAINNILRKYKNLGYKLISSSGAPTSGLIFVLEK